MWVAGVCAEFKVVVQRNMRDKSRIYEDHIALMQAEPDMIKTIAYLLAQTVALHFYEMCALHPLPPSPNQPVTQEF